MYLYLFVLRVKATCVFVLSPAFTCFHAFTVALFVTTLPLLVKHISLPH